jgi:hypothetical protein
LEKLIKGYMRENVAKGRDMGREGGRKGGKEGEGRGKGGRGGEPEFMRCVAWSGIKMR